MSCRQAGEFILARAEKIDFIKETPKQLASRSRRRSIPFLENDDANRALMGSNSERQAVPLLQWAGTFVRTGMETSWGKTAGPRITARRAGAVDQVDGSRIVIRVTDDTARAGPRRRQYTLRK